MQQPDEALAMWQRELELCEDVYAQLREALHRAETIPVKEALENSMAAFCRTAGAPGRGAAATAAGIEPKGRVAQEAQMGFFAGRNVFVERRLNVVPEYSDAPGEGWQLSAAAAQATGTVPLQCVGRCLSWDANPDLLAVWFWEGDMPRDKQVVLLAHQNDVIWWPGYDEREARWPGDEYAEPYAAVYRAWNAAHKPD